MCIYNKNYKGPTSLPNLQPLFDAMISGRTIRKVICMNGTYESENPNNDIVFENFKCSEYENEEGLLSGKILDQAIVNKNAVRLIDGKQSQQRNFYMVWVRSFELGDYMELTDGTQTLMQDPFLTEKK